MIRSTFQCWGALCAIGLLAGCHSLAPQEGNWQSLFNGKDLTGWSVQCLPADAGKDFWKVEDGAIVCDAAGRPDHQYVWLLTDAEFGDFVLQLKFQVDPASKGNSGVQVRSRYEPSADPAGGGWLHGPQVDIHPPTPFRTGLIYDETREVRHWIFPVLPSSAITREQAPVPDPIFFTGNDQWNELTIVCRGTNIRTFLNERPVADYDGAGVLDDADHQRHNVGLRGHVGLQLHVKDELKMRFKDIMIQPLGTDATGA